jgi:very-short-patch-repair endonuclease
MPERSGCLFAILKLFGGTKASAPTLPYRRKDYLLTQAERSLFGVLSEAVGGRYLIFAKVRLLDLVWIPKVESRQAHLNRVQSKHVDFVLCDHANVRPLLCIELDDSSHGRADRVTRDAFLDAALLAAGLPLIRVRARSGYNVSEIREQIEAAITSLKRCN